MTPNILDSVVTITSNRNLESLECSLIRSLTELLPATQVSISHLSIDDSGNTVVTRRVSVAPESEEKQNPALKIDSPYTQIDSTQTQCIEEKETYNYRCDRCCHLNMAIRDDDDEPIAILTLVSPDDFSSSIDTVVAIGKIYRNYLMILTESERDQLTGLLNRRTFDLRFRKLIEDQKAYKKTINEDPNDPKRHSYNGEESWIAIIDIDHFKRVNDQFGHVYGDEILVLVTQLIKKNFRHSDFLFRFGGEEFVALMAPTTEDMAHAALERIRKAIEAYDFPQIGTITISIGYTPIDIDTTATHILGAADQALYYAKNHGRNRACGYKNLIKEKELTAANFSGPIELF